VSTVRPLFQMICCGYRKPIRCRPSSTSRVNTDEIPTKQSQFQSLLALLDRFGRSFPLGHLGKQVVVQHFGPVCRKPQARKKILIFKTQPKRGNNGLVHAPRRDQSSQRVQRREHAHGNVDRPD
jgi:hypothetical protein